MELKATTLGKHLAQHLYHRVKLLNAGVEVCGDHHECLIPFNQLSAINIKRGLVWGELTFILTDEKVVRLHGTEWGETQLFYHHLETSWQRWSQQMSEVTSAVLTSLTQEIDTSLRYQNWLDYAQLQALQQQITQTFAALPLPHSRIADFDNCRKAWDTCQSWLHQGESLRDRYNKIVTERLLEKHADFFNNTEVVSLNQAQIRAVISSETSQLILGGAGSGKTSVLITRIEWLLRQKLATEAQILLITFGEAAAQEVNKRIGMRLHTTKICAYSFHELALHILRESGKKSPQISYLEYDRSARHQLLIKSWQQQCQEKKYYAKGWRDWLSEALQCEIVDDAFWLDESLIKHLAPRLDRWVNLISTSKGSQAAMIAMAHEELREPFARRLKLLTPIVKNWKQRLKAEAAVDSFGLIQRAVDILVKGRFISPWKHILLDDFQDIGPRHITLLSALRRQNSHTSLYAVGDECQATYRINGADKVALSTLFSQHFGGGESGILEATYRVNGRIGDIANRFIQQNPYQIMRLLSSLPKRDKKAVVLLNDDKLDALIDKMSGYVKDHQRILVLARHAGLRPLSLEKAATRWPNLRLDFMLIHDSKGQEADYVIVLGLQSGKEGFPAPACETIIEQVLLPEPEPFPDAEERRLLYVAMTRARHRVWLLFNKQSPSIFVETLSKLGVPVVRHP